MDKTTRLGLIMHLPRGAPLAAARGSKVFWPSLAKKTLAGAGHVGGDAATAHSWRGSCAQESKSQATQDVPATVRCCPARRDRPSRMGTRAGRLPAGSAFLPCREPRLR